VVFSYRQMSIPKFIFLSSIVFVNGIGLAATRTVNTAQEAPSQCLYEYDDLGDEGFAKIDDEAQSVYQGKLAYSYQANLYILDFQTGEVRHFDGVRGMVAPDWHPSGRFIVFGRGNIYSLDTVTGEILTLVDKSETLMEPAWSPDGGSVVYMQIGGDRGLYILDTSNQWNTQMNIENWNSVHPAWSPDGAHISFAIDDETERYQIYTVELDSCSRSEFCELISLTNTPKKRNFEPAWSPDGKQIAFTSERDGYWAIYSMNADGSNQHRLTENEDGDSNPTWSPNGEHIVFSRWNRNDASGIDQDIYVMNSDGSNPQCIIQNGIDPDWYIDTK
jgi:Tol biopolymer transport system component